MNVYKELSIVMFKDKVRGDGYIATATSRFTNDVSTIYHLAAETCEQFELGLSDKETDTLAKKEADIVANVSEPPQLDALIERDMPPANTY
jgi:cell division ATPase FtsA